MITRLLGLCLALTLAVLTQSVAAQSVRIKDLVEFDGVRSGLATWPRCS